MKRLLIAAALAFIASPPAWAQNPTEIETAYRVCRQKFPNGIYPPEWAACGPITVEFKKNAEAQAREAKEAADLKRVQDLGAKLGK